MVPPITLEIFELLILVVLFPDKNFCQWYTWALPRQAGVGLS